MRSVQWTWQGMAPASLTLTGCFDPTEQVPAYN